MVLSKIIGGLGNQMFQYAAGRALAETKGQLLLLDISNFAGYRLHNGFELSRVFVGPFVLAQKQDIRCVLGWRAWPPIPHVLMQRHMAWARGTFFMLEPHFHYWEGFFSVPDDCYLAGYWQSERYFKHIETTIRRAFAFKHSLTGKNAEVAAQIAKGNAVSLHIRRGDYAKDPKAHATHGLLPLSYYQMAVIHVAQAIDNPRFFVFSDDIDWARMNLRLDFPCEYIGHNQGADSYRDMHLMSLCDHHIIANSSFSWWGAWLNSDPDKIVVAPKKWFANANDVSDIFPPGWVVL